MADNYKIVTHELENGGQVQVMIPELTDNGGLVSRHSSTPTQALQKFEDSLSTINKVANATLQSLSEILRKPDEIAIEFGLLLGAEGNAIVVGGKIEGNIKVNITWKNGTGE